MRGQFARWSAPSPEVRAWVDQPAGHVEVVLDRDPRVLRIKSPRGNIYLVLGERITVIDPNLPGEESLVAGALAREGRRLTDVDHVACTHLHFDHASALDSLTEAAGATTLLSPAMAPFVSGEQPYPFPGIRFTWPFLEVWGRVGFPGVRRRHLQLGGNVGYPWSDFKLRTGAPAFVELDRPSRRLGGLVPIHTPGHCPDHTCYLHRATGTLLAGDMFITIRGRLERNHIALDLDAHAESERRLREQGIKAIWPGHGPVMQAN
jgi:glyoxylase-like metal-dependent hydrolase (beta-lactamase superfamily II)